MKPLVPVDIKPSNPVEVPRDRIREKLWELLGLENDRPAVDFTIGRETITEENLRMFPVSYENSLGDTVSGIVLASKGKTAGSRPGIVCMPGTSGSAERVTDLRFFREKPDQGPLIGWGRELARRGFAVIAITLAGCTVRRESESEWDAQEKLLAPFGRSQMGVHVDEALRAARVLIDMKIADADRIGMTGMSLGGNAAWYSIACADWIKASVPVCGGVGSLPRVVHEGDNMRHSHYYYVPHMLRYFDHPEVVSACIAPRPFMVIGPTGDEDMPKSGVDRLVDKVSPVYSALGQPEFFKVYQPDSRHVFKFEYFEWMADWFEKHL